MRYRLVAALAAAALVGGAALSGPATADTGSVADAEGDTGRVNQDITRLRVTNGEDAVRFKVKFDALDPDRRARVKVLVDPAPKDATQYIVASVKRPGETDETWLLLALGMEFDGTPIECDGITGAWDVERASVRVRVPQSCLPENGRVHKFKATTMFGARTGDWTEFLRVRKGTSASA